MVDWKLIEEEAPPEETTVWWSDGECVAVGSHGSRLDYLFSRFWDGVSVTRMTHWAPIATPDPSPQIAVTLFCPACSEECQQDQSWWWDGMDPELKQRIGCWHCDWRGVVSECRREVREVGQG